MAKTPKKNHNTKSVKPTPAKQQTNTTGKNLGKIVGAVCLLSFVVVEELWLATACCAMALAMLFVMQVFLEKSTVWYASGYLYATVLCAVLAYMEFSTQVISRLLDMRS